QPVSDEKHRSLTSGLVFDPLDLQLLVKQQQVSQPNALKSLIDQMVPNPHLQSQQTSSNTTISPADSFASSSEWQHPVFVLPIADLVNMSTALQALITHKPYCTFLFVPAARARTVIRVLGQMNKEITKSNASNHIAKHIQYMKKEAEQIRHEEELTKKNIAQTLKIQKISKLQRKESGRNTDNENSQSDNNSQNPIDFGIDFPNKSVLTDFGNTQSEEYFGFSNINISDSDEQEDEVEAQDERENNTENFKSSELSVPIPRHVSAYQYLMSVITLLQWEYHIPVYIFNPPSFSK
ncbi:MAG: hypothetical protein EZS28_039813, partial [Streblomastix strix]